MNQNGVLIDDSVRDAMLASNRSLALWPLPSGLGIPRLAASALTLPWWKYADERGALLPGHYETVQIMQLLQMENNEKVLLVGPRGNWWTELLMYIGAGHIVILEPEEARRQELIRRWDDLRLDLVANAFGCQIDFIGIEKLDSYTPEGGFDRILSTGMFPALPLSVMMRVQDEGYAVLPIENEGRSMLQLIQHHGEGELMSQWVACWDVDPWSDEVLIALETGVSIEGDEDVIEGSKEIEQAWCDANMVPTRDRFGPDRMLDMVERVWFSIDPVHSDVPEGEFGGLRECISDDLFRMGHVLLQMGIFELATEHLGEAFRLAPTAESATFVGWALNEMDDSWAALGWCRKAIETDDRLGNPWNDIGAILLQMEQPAAAIPWFAVATRSLRYDAPGHPWSNLARAHEALGNKMAAFDAARTALEHSPDDDNCLRIIDDLGGSLL